MKFQLLHGDTLEQTHTLTDASVDCVITSPPYWQKRDYGYPEQWGLEPTFEEFLEHLWSLMDEIWRVLKPEGTVWVNLGDTYGTQSGNMRKPAPGKNTEYGSDSIAIAQPPSIHKCLLMIPSRFAIGCIDRGWILRNNICWGKPNAMPESVTDRFSTKWESFFLLTKQPKYFFDLDAVRDKHLNDSVKRACRAQTFAPDAQYGFARNQEYRGYETMNDDLANGKLAKLNPLGKNPGDVSDFWDISTNGTSDEHYAAYNPELIDKPIRAGCPVGGVILDPFCGRGTTGISALKLERKFIGIDGSAEYLQIADKNLRKASAAMPLFQI